MAVHASAPKIDIPDLNDRHVAIWWHSAIKKNTRDRSQPKVVVSLRVIENDGTYGPIVKRQFPITYLGFLRIGSIWHNKKLAGEIDMETVLLQGHISSQDMKATIQGKMRGGMRQYVIPHHIHDLEDDYFHNQSWLLHLPMETNRGEFVQLTLPCMEIFNRLYGRNVEVRRILATYPWPEASRRLFVPNAGHVDKNVWGIELPSRMINDDTFLIAFLQHDEYAQKQAKSVYAQIEASQSPRGNSQTFLKILPWLLGDVHFKVKGCWISKNHFLGLQINGANIEPEEITIRRSRNYGVAAEEDTAAGAGGGDAPTKVLSSAPENVEVTGDFPPDHHSGYLDIKEDDFEVLGGRGAVVRDNYGSPYRPRSKSSEEDDSRSFSAGEAYGDGKGVGKAEMKSDIVIESEGMLLDFWNALLLLSISEPDTIKKVEYLSKGGFVEGKKPTLVAFKNFFSPEQFKAQVGNWGYVSVRKGKLRGALVARSLTKDGHVYFIEIQRHQRIPRSKEKKEVNEEAYRGIVFRLNDPDEDTVLSTIASIMRSLALRKGRPPLPDLKLDGEIDTYIHRSKSAKSKDAEGKRLVKAELCGNIVRNALAKVLPEENEA